MVRAVSKVNNQHLLSPTTYPMEGYSQPIFSSEFEGWGWGRKVIWKNTNKKKDTATLILPR